MTFPNQLAFSSRFQMKIQTLPFDWTIIKPNQTLSSIIIIIILCIIDTFGYNRSFVEEIVQPNDSDLLAAIKHLEPQMNDRLMFTNHYYRISNITWAFAHKMPRYKFIRYYLYFQMRKTDCKNKRLKFAEHCKWIKEKQPYTAYAEISKNVKKNRFRLMLFKAKRGI